MKKIILSVTLLTLFVLVSPFVIYAETNGYDPKCWNAHMVDQMAVCSRAFLDCVKPCVKMDLKANTACLKACSKIHTDCLKSASAAYRACIEAERKVNQAKPQQSQTSRKGQEQQNKLSKDSNPFNFFGINPFQMWLNLIDLAELRAFMGTGALDRFTESTILHGVGVTPYWERDMEAERMQKQMMEDMEFIQRATSVSTPLADKIKAEELMKKYNEAAKKYNERVEAKLHPILIKHDSVILQLQPVNGQPGILDPEPYWPMLNSGQLDIIVEPQDGQQFELQTPNTEVFVIGTKFSVIYDPKKGQTVVAVYEGKVEVKTKDGKTTTVSPDDDKPGVVVVSQKLSVAKLVFVGVVLAIIIGSVTLILRKKFALKSFKKKK